MTEQGPQLMPGMHVQPSPMTVAVGNTPDHVVLHIENVIGSNIYLLDPDMAEKIGADLASSAVRARSGLILPNG